MKWTMITEEDVLPLVKLKTKKALRRKIKDGAIPKHYYNYNSDLNRYFFRKEVITGK